MQISEFDKLIPGSLKTVCFSVNWPNEKDTITHLDILYLDGSWESLWFYNRPDNRQELRDRIDLISFCKGAIVTFWNDLDLSEPHLDDGQN